jgi:hypothetical protein
MAKTDDHPAWLKAMQNGSIGEARTKAFLLDRFWVLERSVDIEGADFIIQRRLTQHNLLDRQAPRLGVVQAKFFGSTSTTHQIHKEYVVDEEGAPRDEFFLMCHFGDEESSESYLLGAQDIKQDFKLAGLEGEQKYRIPYGDLFGKAKFKVVSRRSSLSRMERQLEHADFARNRHFLSWMLPDASRDLTAILPIYREPIDNGWGDLPKTFVDIKRAAKKSLMDVEEIHQKLVDLTNEVDPLVAEEIVEDIAYHCRDGHGRWSIGISSDLAEEDFFNACRRHKKIVEQLKSDGLLDVFPKIKARLNADLFAAFQATLPRPPDQVQHILIDFDPSTLEITSVQSDFLDRDAFLRLPSAVVRLKELEDHFPPSILDSKLGRIEAHWTPGRMAALLPVETATLEKFVEASSWLCLECQQKMYELKYGEPD